MCCRVLSDTLGRGKSTAYRIALEFMNSREQCMLDDDIVSNDPSALMDKINNKVGAKVGRDLVRTICDVRIGYIFGSECVLSHQEAPSTSAVWNRIVEKGRNAQWVARENMTRFVPDDGDTLVFMRTEDNQTQWNFSPIPNNERGVCEPPCVENQRAHSSPAPCVFMCDCLVPFAAAHCTATVKQCIDDACFVLRLVLQLPSRKRL